jgi:hypothetical protein
MALYMDITSVSSVSEAIQNETVSFTAYMKNLGSIVISGMIGGSVLYGGSYHHIINFPTNWKNINPGSTESFPGSFIMPGESVVLYLDSWWYGSDSMWHFDDEYTKSISLKQIAPTITNLRISNMVRV